MNYRHGDLLLKQVDKLPEKAKKLNTNVLASGTATGHSHTLNGKAGVLEKDGVRYVKVIGKAALKHQEHATINLAKGAYQIVHEREYDIVKEEIRKVED